MKKKIFTKVLLVLMNDDSSNDGHFRTYIFRQSVCSEHNIYGDHELHEDIVCSECRNFTICPFLKHTAFCKELKFINRIDTEKMQFNAYFVTIWGKYKVHCTTVPLHKVFYLM